MRKRALLSDVSAEEAWEVQRVEEYALGWLLDCEIRKMSAETLKNRRGLLDKFFWFLRERRIGRVGPNEVKAFFLYLNRAHLEPGGRWGNPREVKPLAPGTVVSYFNILRSFWNAVVEEHGGESPMARMKAPLDRPDDILTFTPEQFEALLQQARLGLTPKRDAAILLLLLDTGLRASELCALRRRDLDLITRQLTVEGKGGKKRTLPFGKKATKALWLFLKDERREPADFLFVGDRGHTPGAPLTRSGLGILLRKLGKRAGLEAVRCSPHTFRHTFAYLFLQNGGNQFALMRLLGHTDLAMTHRYVKLVQADVDAQHRAHSPADRLRKR